MESPNPLVDATWLRNNIDREDVKVIDASWLLSTGTGETYQSYLDAHITGAHFFDIDKVSDDRSSLPHMLPTEDTFSNVVNAIGLLNTDTVIIYTTLGANSAARVWWTFRVMGHNRVFVLDGGLRAWAAMGGEMSSEIVTPTPSKSYITAFNSNLVATAGLIRKNLTSGTIIDARPQSRFDGQTPEPRAELRSGSMPNAINIPTTDLITSEGYFKSLDELKALFASTNLTNGPIITTCGSGITAAVLSLALYRLGIINTRLYDGSWAEWGMSSNDPNLYPVVSKK